jgi:hypothetical protein
VLVWRPGLYFPSDLWRRMEPTVSYLACSSYRPALRRLAAQGEPGASDALAELDEGTGERIISALEFLRRDMESIVYASGDRHRHVYFQFALDQGRLRAGDRTDDTVMADLVENFDDVSRRGTRTSQARKRPPFNILTTAPLGKPRPPRAGALLSLKQSAAGRHRWLVVVCRKATVLAVGWWCPRSLGDRIGCSARSTSDR